MQSSRYQLDFIQAGIDQLKDYLFSSQIYRPIGIQSPSGQPAYPQLTLGTLLLFLHQAEAYLSGTNLQSELIRSNNDLELMRTQWHMHWRRKAKAEYQARIKLWGDFLTEYEKDPEDNYDRYAFEVTRRVMLEWLKSEAAELSTSEIETLDNLDRLLKSFLVEGEFVWDKKLLTQFPRDPFWYLYGNLSAN